MSSITKANRPKHWRQKCNLTLDPAIVAKARALVKKQHRPSISNLVEFLVVEASK